MNTRRCFSVGSGMLIMLFLAFPVFGHDPEASSRPTNSLSTTQNCVNDDFSTSTLSPEWTWVDPLGDSSYSLTANPGYLRILTPDGGHDMATWNTNAPRLIRPLSDSFHIETKVVVNPVQTYQAAGLIVWFDSSNFLWIARSTGNKIGHHFVRAGDENNPPEVTGIANTTVYLRVDRNADTFLTYFSLNGVDWTLTGSIEYPSGPSTAQAGLLLINNWQDNPISADFDYFRAGCYVYLPLVMR